MKALVVVYPYSYVLKRFLPLKKREVYFSFGDEIPSLDSFFWMSGFSATRIISSDVHLKLAAPSQGWLSSLSTDITGREIFFRRLDEVSKENGEAFFKPAGVKIPALKAGFYDAKRFVDLAYKAGLVGDDEIEFTFAKLSLNHEHRFVVLDSEVKTGSPYFVDGEIYKPGMKSERSQIAESFAKEVAQEVKDLSPRAYSLDVGFDENAGRWVCVEANPLWSSGPYGCDKEIFVEALEVANSEGDWKPSPWLMRRAAMVGKVKQVPVELSLKIQ